MILKNEQIRQNIAIIKCGNQIGTSFLISNNIAITAKHVTQDYNKDSSPILLNFMNIKEDKIKIKATPIKLPDNIDIQLDIEFLELEEEIIGFEHLSFTNVVLPENAKWVSFGYPKIDTSHGTFIEGVINQKNEYYNPTDYDLILKYNSNDLNTEGLSGAPVVVGGNVIGVITSDKGFDNLLGAIHVNKFLQYLAVLDINYRQDNTYKKITNIIEEKQTILDITNYIQNNKSGYIFIKGNPGSGKTTLAINLDFESDDIEVIGKYFLKDKNDQINLQYKASEIVFGKWIVNSVSKFLYNTLINEKNYADYELNEISSQYLKNLSVNNKINKKYVFLVDGTDEIYDYDSSQYKKFLSMLPSYLYDDIFFIIFGVNDSRVPNHIKNYFNEFSVINIKPLHFDKVFQYLNDNLRNIKITYEQLVNLTRKTEGNPLYIHYIIEYLKKNNVSDDIINQLPPFEGEIKNYYKIIWNFYQNDVKVVKVLSILSRIRKHISKKALIRILDSEEQLMFDNTVSKIEHLIDCTDNYLSIYHSSFSIFINIQTKINNIQIHKLISNYCLIEETDIFSIENKLYHLLNCDKEYIVKAIELCNQSFIDQIALNNINPDIVMEDIRNILREAIRQERVSEVIRILLLLERFNFRNQVIFKEYSSNLARALYEIGKKKSTITYLIREGVLITDFSEALFFLRKYLMDHLYDEADILYKAIQSKCHQEYDSGKVSIETLLIDIESTSLIDKYDITKKLEGVHHILSEIEYENVDQFFAYINGKISAYNLWYRGIYLNIDKYRENFEITPILLDVLKYLIFNLEEFEYKYYKFNSSNRLVVIKDIENLINEFNIEKDDDLVNILIKYSDNIKLISSLIKKEDKHQISLRQENGVDFNYNSFEEFFNYYVRIGFIEDTLEINKGFNWEENLINITKKIGYNTGRLYRANIEKDKKKIVEIKIIINEIQDELNINLKDRIKWKRSYFIPEHILPLLWEKVSNIYILFYGEKIDDLISSLINNKHQLGMYIEGYKRALFNVCNKLLINQNIARKAYDLIKRIETIVSNYTLNRWERTRDFLKIIEMLGKIDCSEDAKNIYKDMLNTSMGPSWYKEAQLNLLSNIMKKSKIPNKDIYIKEILGDLDYASGEMTFQRYVRDAKEEFVGVISDTLGLKHAIEYYKFLTFPPFNLLIKNVNISEPDKIDDSNGYTQGTGEIDTQDGIISLFSSKEFSSIDPILKWGITELFIQGDDRYFDKFVNLQISLYLQISEINELNKEKIFHRIKRQFISELDDKRRKKYLNLLNDLRTDYLIDNLYEDLMSIIDFENDEYNEDEVSSNDDGTKDVKDDFLLKCSEELHYGNKNKVKEMLSNEIEILSSETGMVFNYSRHSMNCLSMLSNLADSASEFINSIMDVIVNYQYEPWMIVDYLIDYLSPLLKEDESKNIIEESLYHFRNILRTPSENIDKYKWIEYINNEEEKNLLIAKFIIWFLNFPINLLFKHRIIDVIFWLTKLKPDIFIPLLFNESLQEEYNQSNEKCAYILHGLSKTDMLDSIWYFLNAREGIKEKIINLNNFIIKSCFYEIIKSSEKKNLYESDIFLTQLKQSFLNEKIDHLYNYTFDNPLLNCVNPLLNKLKTIIPINDDFSDKLIMYLENKVIKCKINEYKKCEYFIERSYHLNTGSSEIYKSLLLNGINTLIIPYVTNHNYYKLLELLREYNPSFPNNYLSYKIPKISEKIIAVFNQEPERIENYLLYNDKILLHFIELFENEQRDHFNNVEIIAFLIDKDIPHPAPYDKLYENFYINMLPYEQINSSNLKNIVPLVHKMIFSKCDDSMFTPSNLSTVIKNKVRNDECEKMTWRNGRVLDVYRFGMPIQEGCLLSIDKKALERVKGDKKLMYKVIYNDSIIFLDMDNKIIY